jgi:hypothetical protein
VPNLHRKSGRSDATSRKFCRKNSLKRAGKTPIHFEILLCLAEEILSRFIRVYSDAIQRREAETGCRPDTEFSRRISQIIEALPQHLSVAVLHLFNRGAEHVQRASENS